MKYFIALTILLLTSLNLYSQYNKSTVSIDVNEVPLAIKTYHNKKYPSSTNENWSVRSADQEGIMYYKVIFKDNGLLGQKAFYDTEGFVGFVGHIYGKNLPESIQIKATSYFDINTVKQGQIIELNEPYIFIYRLKINNQGLLEHVYFDKYGNVLDKNNLPSKIFTLF